MDHLQAQKLYSLAWAFILVSEIFVKRGLFLFYFSGEGSYLFACRGLTPINAVTGFEVRPHSCQVCVLTLELAQGLTFLKNLSRLVDLWSVAFPMVPEESRW